MAKSKSGLKTTFQILAAEVVKGAFLFGSAGTLRWWQGWVYLLSGVFFGVAATVTLSRESPELLEERKTAAKKAKPWDKIIVLLLIIILPTCLYVFAGLDRRWHWTRSITVLESLGALLVLLASNTLFLWAQKTNAFFSSFARIQDDRGHQVVSSGPYRVVRHPGYIGLMLGSLALPILLGSLPALGVGVLICILNVVRTELEDRMLRSELKNYQEYAAKVRYKLVPFIW
ncbi:MAG: isoprenylcysteine carboxylmethyltransferase family protein [Candidatus Firestonebacteria bacterium]|nr:isoprenylcysteine carboxylmethyltransferase family protein [Candidatus Firestonebacteria bacterium]